MKHFFFSFLLPLFIQSNYFQLKLVVLVLSLHQSILKILSFFWSSHTHALSLCFSLTLSLFYLPHLQSLILFITHSLSLSLLHYSSLTFSHTHTQTHIASLSLSLFHSLSHTHTHTNTHYFSLTLSLTLSLSLSDTHTHTLFLSHFFYFHLSLSLSFTRTHAHCFSLSYAPTHTHTHTHYVVVFCLWGRVAGQRVKRGRWNSSIHLSVRDTSGAVGNKPRAGNANGCMSHHLGIRT